MFPASRCRLSTLPPAPSPARARHLDADCLVVSGGWSPVIHLASQAGAAPKWDEKLQAFLPPEPTQNWIGAGAFNGHFTTAEALVEGLSAGLRAANSGGHLEAAPEVEHASPFSEPAPSVRDSGARARPSSTSSTT